MLTYLKALNFNKIILRILAAALVSFPHDPFPFLRPLIFSISSLSPRQPRLSHPSQVSVVFPPALAYGDDGLPPKVPPNTPVHLIVELISFYDDQEQDDDGGEGDE